MYEIFPFIFFEHFEFPKKVLLAQDFFRAFFLAVPFFVLDSNELKTNMISIEINNVGYFSCGFDGYTVLFCYKFSLFGGKG